MFALRSSRFVGSASGRSAAGLAAGALAAAAGCYGLAAACDAPGASVKSVTARLGRLVVDVPTLEATKVLTRRTDLNGVTIYSVTNEAAHSKAGGLPVVRVAEAVIKAPVAEVAALWWHVQSRKDWDSVNTQDCQLVKALGTDERLVYLQGKPKRGGVISSRDFAYVMHRVPAQELGARTGSALFIQTNTASEVPANSSSVRGDVNSLLLLEPLDATTTRARYAIEIDVKGWLPTKVVNAAADETPLTLAVMRDHLERQ
ncbi:hypothetical protein JKP88DRAFT_224095 [Tribonema minus]|uniref:START domain-containing protein n=1 Tax=Tribonema minus TaxID=303371 RepID=A0A835YTY3_9STRA|nr:hypothetical protein JKP88DRAFT_224095 [Tribonema minus]